MPNLDRLHKFVFNWRLLFSLNSGFEPLPGECWVLNAFSHIVKARQISLQVYWLLIWFAIAPCMLFPKCRKHLMFFSLTASFLSIRMPLVVSRVGRLDRIDTQLFFVASRDFYSQLSYNVSYQRAFTETFRQVEQPDTPYMEILLFCNSSNWADIYTHIVVILRKCCSLLWSNFEAASSVFIPRWWLHS